MAGAAFRRFLTLAAAGGLVTAAAIGLAIGMAQSSAATRYHALLGSTGLLQIDALGLTLAWPLAGWITELWMAVFFLVAGLALKREVLAGSLSSPRQMFLPVGAAVGAAAGAALVGALTCTLLEVSSQPVPTQRWAIWPTDLALVLAALWLLGSRVPLSLKFFIGALALCEAVLVVFVSAVSVQPDLRPSLWGTVGLGAALLVALNRYRLSSALPYLAAGLLLWLGLAQAGVPAALAGALTAVAIPLQTRDESRSPLVSTLNAVAPWVWLGVWPALAFALAGQASAAQGIQIPLAIATGLWLGKPLGAFAASLLLARWAGCELPPGANRWQFFGVCVMSGVGGTLSLFASGLAFSAAGHAPAAKLGVLGGSLVALVVGGLILLLAERRGPARRRQQMRAEGQ